MQCQKFFNAINFVFAAHTLIKSDKMEINFTIITRLRSANDVFPLIFQSNLQLSRYIFDMAFIGLPAYVCSSHAPISFYLLKFEIMFAHIQRRYIQCVLMNQVIRTTHYSHTKYDYVYENKVARHQTHLSFSISTD